MVDFPSSPLTTLTMTTLFSASVAMMGQIDVLRTS
jgi:hypothetical protein